MNIDKTIAFLNQTGKKTFFQQQIVSLKLEY